MRPSRSISLLVVIAFALLAVPQANAQNFARAFVLHENIRSAYGVPAGGSNVDLLTVPAGMGFIMTRIVTDPPSDTVSMSILESGVAKWSVSDNTGQPKVWDLGVGIPFGEGTTVTASASDSTKVTVTGYLFLLPAGGGAAYED